MKADESQRSPAKVFYSWQSDLPNKTNRSLIEDALNLALKSINGAGNTSVELDQDSRGVPGSPDIPAVIFEKIRSAAVVVCDVSIVTESGAPRPSPNPNVLVELGYAYGTSGPIRVVSILNEATGSITDLPFDVSRRRVVTYRMSEEDQPATARNGLAKKLTSQIQAILAEAPTQNAPLGIEELEATFASRRSEFQSHLQHASEDTGSALLGLRATLAPTLKIQVDYRASYEIVASLNRSVEAQAGGKILKPTLPFCDTVKHPKPMYRGVSQELSLAGELSHQFHVFENGVIDCWWIDRHHEGILSAEWVVAFLVSACRVVRAVLSDAQQDVEYRLELEIHSPGRPGTQLHPYSDLYWRPKTAELANPLTLPWYEVSISTMNYLISNVLRDIFNSAGVDPPELRVALDEEIEAPST